jgi:hypothetical protein
LKACPHAAPPVSNTAVIKQMLARLHQQEECFRIRPPFVQQLLTASTH